MYSVSLEISVAAANGYNVTVPGVRCRVSYPESNTARSP